MGILTKLVHIWCQTIKKLPRGIFHLYEELHRKFYIKVNLKYPLAVHLNSAVLDVMLLKG